MKPFINLFVICAALASFCSAYTKEELIQKGTELGKNCQAKEGASNQDFQEFMTDQVPTTEAGRCLRACVMETLNVLIDNKPNSENAITLTAELSNNNADLIKLVKELNEECHPTAVGANRCETAYNIIKCGTDSMKKRGVDFSKYYESL